MAATETFTPPFAPSQDGTSGTITPRVIKAQFGDGYTQRAVDGLNSQKEMWKFLWKGLTLTERNEILDFFEARGGVEAFNYTPPSETVAMQFTCVTWQKASAGGNLWIVTADFEQEFDI